MGLKKLSIAGLLFWSAQGLLAQRQPLPPAPQPQAIADNGKPLAIVNGRPYQRPTRHDFFRDYLNSMYGPWGITGTTVRALYAEGRGKPSEWDQSWDGFGKRYGSSAAVTVINSTVRYGMENIFREDLRYIPCHGCTAKRKIENSLLAEITARHEDDGRRFFTLTPVVSDFSGPIITHALWYPGAASGPFAGVVAARTVFATRIGLHLFREFVLERKHHDPPERGPH